MYWSSHGNADFRTEPFNFSGKISAHRVNPLDISQWEFFVLPTKVLDEREQSQHSITLPSLKKLTDSVSFFELGQAVDKAKDES